MTQMKIDVRAIAKPLDNEAVYKTDATYVIDEIIEGAPLVITFGFYNPDNLPHFDFYERMKRIQQLSGVKMNLLMVRDLSRLWYQKGIGGMGDNIVEVTGCLMDMIRQIKPSKVITIGQSMGGYGALTFGALLEVDKIISFGPLSFFSTQMAMEISDFRWIAIMQEVDKNPPQPYVPDLVDIMKLSGNLPETHIIYGMLHDDGINPGQDEYHAKRLQISDRVFLHPVNESTHTVVHYLKENKLINRLLIKLMLDIEMDNIPTDPLPEDWCMWIRNNFAAGVSAEEVKRILLENKFGEAEIDAAIKREKEDLTPKTNFF